MVVLPLRDFSMANWSDEDVLQLITLWGEEGVQEQLEGAKRNKHVYEKLAKEMQKRGSAKTAEQCRAKMKKLKLEYRKIKDKHNQTGQGRKSWKFLESMDAVLGNRPATRPSEILDTSENQEEEQVEALDEAEEEEGESFYDQSSSVNTVEESTSDDEAKQQSVPSSSGIKAESSSGIKGKKRKRTKEEKIEAMLTTVVKEVVDAQQQSDKMFIEMDEKRMKFEAEQRKEEREFQLQMMSMLFGNPSPRTTPGSFGSYPYPGYQ